ncbi:MAG: lipoprotein signal peptidase [Bacteroidales bacterium]|nr:lipoprotein signal peptidase [Bacteroidales bacterium]
MPRLSRTWKAALIILLLVLLDQAVKFAVKTHMQLHDSIRVTDWFYIYFTENNGMAFGWELFDKIFLTLFRILASGLLVWYLSRLCRRPGVKMGYIVCIALITAGALGNIFDCLFYGLVFDHSYGQVATLFPRGGGYAPLFYGQVVDMLYFPLIDTVWPDWVPFWGGKEFVFFRPVFNIADSCITVGVFALIIFYHKSLAYDLDRKSPSSAANEKKA